MYLLNRFILKTKRKENKNGKRTRAELLEAAGCMFAKKGFEATSVRDIAKLAHTPFGAITYHFKTKKNLFKRTLEHFILDNARFDTLFEAFDKADPTKPETLSVAMFESVRNLVYVCHKPGFRIKNINGLIITLLRDGGKEANKMIQVLGNETMANVYRLLHQANPRLSDTDVYWWSHMFWALIFYPMYGELLLLSESGEKKYSAEFLDSLAYRTAYACCVTLGLPIPQGEDNWRLSKGASTGTSAS